MRTIIITGGTGLIGTALGRALLEKGYRIIILSTVAVAATRWQCLGARGAPHGDFGSPRACGHPGRPLCGVPGAVPGTVRER